MHSCENPFQKQGKKMYLNKRGQKGENKIKIELFIPPATKL
jgi:hypothetical protein